MTTVSKFLGNFPSRARVGAQQPKKPRQTFPPGRYFLRRARRAKEGRATPFRVRNKGQRDRERERGQLRAYAAGLPFNRANILCFPFCDFLSSPLPVSLSLSSSSCARESAVREGKCEKAGDAKGGLKFRATITFAELSPSPHSRGNLSKSERSPSRFPFCPSSLSIHLTR